ncbi:MAG TPA: hypothetical protein VNU21_12285 [Usitatibacter sp.]|nr:hypothetical protein [Usitatibacter sp.]
MAGAAQIAAAFLIGPPPPKTVLLKEYVNDITHHFVLLVPSEAQQVEQGSAGPGWRFTGYEFAGYDVSETQAVAQNALPVCRFYAPPPTNSHFYTADPAECDFLRTHDTGWNFEKIDLKIDVPHDGVCALGLTPIHRQYNNRFAFNDSNHRFNFDERVQAKMAAQGFVDEGIAFCAVNADRPLKASIGIFGTDIAPSATCRTLQGVSGSCVTLVGLPDMTRSIGKFVPPTSSHLNPDYSPAFAQITGWLSLTDDTVWTAWPAAQAPSHSFVEWELSGMPVGVHVDGSERTGGDYASASPSYRFIPASATAADALYPWGDGHEHDLFAGFNLLVTTVRRNDDASHAYGGPVIDFVDAKSGRHLFVSVLAFGTQQPGDVVARDANNGTPIVGTTFRAEPLFGKRLRGDFIPCVADASSGSCRSAGMDFMLRIDQDDFAKVIGLARTLEPALSTSIADYFVAGYQFRNETFRDARLGVEEHAIELFVTQ